MARKRTIKPNFFEDETMSKLSPWARLLYIGMWCHMDGNGVIEALPKLIKSKVFPLEEHSVSDVEKWLEELLSSGRLKVIKHVSKVFFICPNFKTHQKLYADDKKIEIPEKSLSSYLNDTSWKKEETSCYREETSRVNTSPSPSASLPNIGDPPKLGVPPLTTPNVFKSSSSSTRSKSRNVSREELDAFFAIVSKNFSKEHEPWFPAATVEKFLRTFPEFNSGMEYWRDVFERAAAKFKTDREQLNWIGGAMRGHVKQFETGVSHGN